MRRREGNIKFYTNNTRCEGVNLIHPAHHRDNRKVRIYLTVYNSFTDVVDGSDYIAFNGRMISEACIENDAAVSGRDPVPGAIPEYARADEERFDHGLRWRALVITVMILGFI
jgi:hypothetical protein